MKRFLLLALTAGLLSPIAAKAETWWLLIDGGKDAPAWQIPTSSKKDCNEQKEIVLNKKNWDGNIWSLSGICLKGK